MDLWIRSQNRRKILKCNIVEIRGKSINQINFIVFEDYEIVGYFDDNIGHEILGAYETEERALEVLDEIQDILKPKYILDASSIKPDGNFYEEDGMIFQKYNANAEIKELSTFVYQMPEK